MRRHGVSFHASPTRVLRAKGLAPPTIKHAFTPLKRVLRRAVQDEILVSNPADGVALPTDRSTGRAKPQPTFLTEQQVERLAGVLDMTEPMYGLLERFLAYTGLRAGDVAGLGVADIKLGRIQVHRTRAKVRGGWAVSTPKTARSERHVPLPGWLRDDLAMYLASTHPRGSDPAAPLWPGQHRYPEQLGGHFLNWSEPWERGVFYKVIWPEALRQASCRRPSDCTTCATPTLRSAPHAASRLTASTNTWVTPTFR